MTLTDDMRFPPKVISSAGPITFEIVKVVLLIIL